MIPQTSLTDTDMFGDMNGGERETDIYRDETSKLM